MASNVCTVRLNDGREVLLSYGVPVAAFIPGSFYVDSVGWLNVRQRPNGYIKTSRRYSVTTSRHANSYAGDGAATVDDAMFRALIAPITDSH